jgi:hypothetical protein
MTYKEISHVNNELPKHEDDLTSIDKALTRCRKHIAWRRQKVFTMLVQGITSTYDIASVLKVSQSTAVRDCRYLKEQAARELRTHITERVTLNLIALAKSKRATTAHFAIGLYWTRVTSYHK